MAIVTLTEIWNKVVGVLSSMDIPDYITAAAAVWAASIAHRGVNAWKSELIGRSDHELASRLLLRLYRWRDAIEAARSPGMSSSEYADYPGTNSEPPRMKKSSDEELAKMQYAYEKRLNRIREALSKLEVTCKETEALWNYSFAAEKARLRDCYFELMASIYYWIGTREQGRIDEGQNDEYMTHFGNVFGSYGPKDTFHKKYTEAIRDFEPKARKRLARKV